MKRRASLGLVVMVFSGMFITACAAPSASRDTEARLQNLENKVASYADLRPRVDALEEATRAKGILEPALSTENLPPLPQTEAAAGPHSSFAVSSVPGQKEVTPPPIPLPPLTTANSVTKQTAPVPQATTQKEAAPAPVVKQSAPPEGAAAQAQVQAPKQDTPPQTAGQTTGQTTGQAAGQPAPRAEAAKEPPSPFTARQDTPPDQNAASPFTTKSTPPVVNTQERQAQATPQPPITQADAGANAQKQTQPQAQNQAQTQTPPQAQAQTQAQAAPSPQPQAQPQTQPQVQAQKPTPPPGKSDKSVYESALALYEAGKPAASRQAMSAFLESYPSSAYVPNALYWIGESHYSQSQWDQAILSFKDVVARFPKHAKAADALLKLGMCYEKLKDKDNARFHYEALIEDFPASRAAGLAKPKLSAL